MNDLFTPRIEKNLSVDEFFKRGIQYRDGIGVVTNEDLAFEYLLAAARLKHVEAQLELGLMLYERGKDEEAKDWIYKAAKQGFGPAQHCVAANFPASQTNRDELYQMAHDWYLKRANAGDAEAQYDIGLMYWRREVPGSRSVGTDWIRKAALQDHLHACRILGQELLSLEASHVLTEEAIEWLKRAAKLGSPNACNVLGDLYLFGHSGKEYDVRAGKTFPNRIIPDVKTAIEWFEKGLTLYNSPYARETLGRHFLFGKYMLQNIELGEKYLIEAALAGNASAQNVLANEYTNGEILPKNLDEAIRWYSMAITSGRKLLQPKLDTLRVYMSQGMVYVFQYGSNCLQSELNNEDRLNGDASFVSLACTTENYELTFDVASKKRKCAASNIVKGGASPVYGALYIVPDFLIERGTAEPKGRKSFDQIEGEGTNYSRERIKVKRLDDNSEVEAITYTTIKPIENIQTSLDYVTLIVRGLRKIKAPDWYITKIKEIAVQNNPDLKDPVSKL